MSRRSLLLCWLKYAIKPTQHRHRQYYAFKAKTRLFRSYACRLVISSHYQSTCARLSNCHTSWPFNEYESITPFTRPTSNRVRALVGISVRSRKLSVKRKDLESEHGFIAISIRQTSAVRFWVTGCGSRSIRSLPSLSRSPSYAIAGTIQLTCPFDQ
jgi:hypothetical protein